LEHNQKQQHTIIMKRTPAAILLTIKVARLLLSQQKHGQCCRAARTKEVFAQSNNWWQQFSYSRKISSKQQPEKQH
jgi:hypothetical protein